MIYLKMTTIEMTTICTIKSNDVSTNVANPVILLLIFAIIVLSIKLIVSRVSNTVIVIYLHLLLSLME